MSERPDPPINYFGPSILWKAFCWSWWWAIPLCVIQALACFYLPQWLNRPVYVATHNLKEVSSDLSRNDESELALADRQRSLVRHASVLNPVLEFGELRAAPSLSNPATIEAELRKRLKVQSSGSKKVMTISYEDSDAEYAARICNAIAGQYLRVRSDMDDRRYGELQQWLNEPIRIWTLNLENKRQELRELTKEAQGFDPFKTPDPQLAAYSKLERLEAKVHELEAEMRASKAKLEMYSEAYRVREPSSADADEEEATHEDVSSEMADRILELRAEYVSAQARKRTYEEAYDAEKSRIEVLPGETARILLAKEEYRQAQEMHRTLLTRLNLLQAEANRGSSIRTLAQATAPATAEKRIYWWQTTVFTIVCWLFTCGMALVGEIKRIDVALQQETE